MTLLLALLLTGADALFERAMEFAARQDWAGARGALTEGAAAYPGDKRFPIELAGVAFRLDDPSTARRHLRRALSLDPGDAYANDFLGTLYLLDGNVEAAVKFFNRAGRPRLSAVELPAGLRTDPVLLDGALRFAPGSVLAGEELLATRARLDLLGVFSQYRFTLVPEDSGDFTMRLAAMERNGPGAAKWLMPLRGVFFQTVLPEYANWRGRAVHMESLLRWDRQKQRARVAVSAPWKGNPATRARLYLDSFRETWDLSRTFRGGLGSADSLALRRTAAGVRFDTVAAARWRLWTGAEGAWRGLPNRARFGLQSHAAFQPGFGLALPAGFTASLLRVPEHRFMLTGESGFELGRTLRSGLRPYVRHSAAVDAEWFAAPEDFRLHGRLQGGWMRGDAPLDRYFQLGVERDNDLLLRAHPGTAAGRKGSAPLGRDFVLANTGFEKTLYRGALWSVAAGPWWDAGKAGGGRAGFGSGGWLFDAGVQGRIRLLGGASVLVSWGRDLRTGGNAFYARLGEF